jgi:hypothetical protein
VIGRISSQGTVTTYVVPTTAAGPSDIAAAADGTLWFTEGSASRIGRIALAVRPPAPPGAPTISSFSPGSGPAGTAVAIAGTKLAGTTGVWFHGTLQPDFEVDPTGTLISTRVPAGATSGEIVVATPGGTVATSTGFVVTSAPLVHTRSVTLHLGAHLHARGLVRVEDGFMACLTRRHVTIQRHVQGRWRTVGGDLTDAGGRYALTVPDRSGWYRAVLREVPVADGGNCGAAVSRTRLHPA